MAEGGRKEKRKGKNEGERKRDCLLGLWRFALEDENILTLFCDIEDLENKNYRSDEPRVMDENQSMYVIVSQTL